MSPHVFAAHGELLLVHTMGFRVSPRCRRRTPGLLAMAQKGCCWQTNRRLHTLTLIVAAPALHHCRCYVRMTHSLRQQYSASALRNIALARAPRANTRAHARELIHIATTTPQAWPAQTPSECALAALNDCSQLTQAFVTASSPINHVVTYASLRSAHRASQEHSILHAPCRSSVCIP
jgi:hypothetical protein